MFINDGTEQTAREPGHVFNIIEYFTNMKRGRRHCTAKFGVINIFIAPAVEDMAWFTQWSISPGGGTDEIGHVTDMAITI